MLADADMTTPRPLFLPTARQTNWLTAIAFLAAGEAMYVRYQAGSIPGCAAPFG
jgi:hypothetical protein